MDIAERTLQLKADFNGVYEVGKKAEYNEFWNNLGTNQSYRFSGTAWNKNTFKPNKNFSVGNYGFYYHNWQGTAYDLAAHLETLGIVMTLKSMADQQTFRNAWFTRLPELDFSKCSGQFDRVFDGCEKLVTIDKIILPQEGQVTSFNVPFTDCTKLANVIFEGVLDKSINFSQCPLTVASLKSIISCLKNFTGGSEYSCTLTLKSSAFSALETEWAEIIDDKKWNLALA